MLLSMRSIVVLLTALALLQVPSAALADKAQIKDATHDVYEVLPGEFDEHIPAGTRPNTDVRRTVVDHRANALVTVLHYVSLDKGRSRTITYSAFLNIGQGNNGNISMEVEVDPSLVSARVALSDFLGEFDCAGARATVKPAKDKVRVRVPRSCLGNPEWVRFRGQARSFSKAERLFVDYASSSGPSHGRQTEKLFAG